jgi:uncharacterized membrane protein YfhO
MNTQPDLQFFVIPFIFIGLIALLFTVFWIWTLVDCIKNEPDTGNDKIIWLLVIVLLHSLGALIYLLARRPQRIEMYGR